MKKQTNNTSKNKDQACHPVDDIINTLIDAIVAHDSKKAYLPLWDKAVGKFCDYYNQCKGAIYYTGQYTNVESAAQVVEIELPCFTTTNMLDITPESIIKRIDYILCALLFDVLDRETMNVRQAAEYRNAVFEVVWDLKMAWHLKKQIESIPEAA